MSNLCQHVVKVLHVEGPQTFDKLSELCDAPRTYIEVAITRLCHEQRIHAQQIDGATVYAYGAGRKAERTQPQADEDRDRERELLVVGKLCESIKECLALGPCSDGLLRERVGCASYTRWRQAITVLHRSGVLKGNNAQWRLPESVAILYRRWEAA